MGLADAYRARKQEQLRERMLAEAYARRAQKARQEAHEEEFGRRYRQEQEQCTTRPRRYSTPKPPTAPNYSRATAQRPASHYVFGDASDLSTPSWTEKPHRGGEPRLRTAERHAAIHRAPRHPQPERTMPDLASDYAPDSFAARACAQNYHPSHGHRYLRDDQYDTYHARAPFVQPLSYGRRAPGETSGYRGRLFGEGNPPPPPPKRDFKPQPVYGPPQEGWF